MVSNKWELVSETESCTTSRMQTPEGWIVMNQTISPTGAISESMCFVKDMDHDWSLV